MYDVIERARKAVENDETVDLDKLQSFANETKDMVATKAVHHILTKLQKVILILVHKVVFIFLMQL